MAEVEYQMTQLVNLAIGSPEIGAVNFNILQKVLVEMLRLTDLETATIQLSPSEAAKIEETYQVKPVSKEDIEMEESKGSIRRSGQLHQCPIDPEKVDHLLEDMNQLKFDVEDLMNKVATMAAAPDTVPYQEMRGSISKTESLVEKVKQLESALENMKDLGDSGQRLLELEQHAEKQQELLAKMDKAVEDKIKNVTEHVEDLEKELGEIHERLNLVSVGGSALTNKKSMAADRSSAMDHQTNSSINNLISRLSSVQHDLDNLTLVTSDLKEEQEQRQMIIDVLTEQVELLKTMKADKVNMEDNLAAKADMIHVLRKVSHDHFETRMEQLNHMVEDTFTRLDAHEEMWQEEVEVLKVDLQQKLDKMEFTPLKEYVNEKLKMLQDKMKTLASQRREGEAAGSKRKVIRDVQCISCDNESVMRSANSMGDMMPPPPLPAQQSIKPFLTYKLDQVRKQQQKLPPGRNLHHFEEMLSECTEGKKPKMLKTASRSGEHLVNRYVGGSHTTTTPQQRVTRTGNFFQTWGPIITAVNKEQMQPVA